MTIGPRTRISPSPAMRSSTPGVGPTDGADLDRSRGFAVPTTHSSHAPQSAIGTPIAWKNSSTSTGVGAAPVEVREHLVEADSARSARRSSAPPRDLPAASARVPVDAACSRRTCATPRRSRLQRSRLLLGRPGANIVSKPGLELLPHARHREEPARPDFGQVGEHLPRVRAAGDLQTEHDRQIVVRVALRDVGVELMGILAVPRTGNWAKIEKGNMHVESALSVTEPSAGTP